MEKTEEHFQEAKKENKNSFRAVDPDGDGERVTDHIPDLKILPVRSNLNSDFMGCV